MRTTLAGLAVVAMLLTSCGITAAADKHNDDGAFDGLWLLTEAEVDGRPVPIDERLFLEVDGNRATGDSTCNPVGGVFGSRPGASETKLCAAEPQGRFDPMAVEYAMRDAILSGPEPSDGGLVFAKGGNRFVYEPVADPSPADLFAVIDDDTSIADPDEIVLDAEGGPPPPFQRLVRLHHAGTDTRFHLGVDGDLLCLVHSSGDTGGYYCRPRVT
jgi:hypothetical protein